MNQPPETNPETRLTHSAPARNPRSYAILLTLYCALWAAWLWLDASPLILAAVALFTLPALAEIALNRHASFRLTDQSIEWQNGPQSAHLPLSQIDHIRFDTRLDLSVRVTIRLKNGQRQRPPHACLPPHRQLEQALQALAIPTQRHHFSLMG